MRWYGRLARSGEIAFVRRRGRRTVTETCAVFSLPERAPTRVCVTVSKTVGGAVVRNLVRRRIRGALDTLPALPPDARIVIVAKPAAAGVSYARLAADVGAAVRADGARRP